MEQDILIAVDALRRGETLLYPTDTIWGIGCDARRPEAVERLYAIKQRDRSKSMLVLCVPELLSIPWPPVAADNLSQRPTTYILPAEVWQRAIGVPLADNLSATDGSLGVRMVQHHPFCSQAIARLGAPIVSTSANLSGRPSPTTYEEIDSELMTRVDCCVPPRPQYASSALEGSRILKVISADEYVVIRP